MENPDGSYTVELAGSRLNEKLIAFMDAIDARVMSKEVVVEKPQSPAQETVTKDRSRIMSVVLRLLGRK
jgi:hypothetical protein